MNDGMLSQEEIDALLKIGIDDDEEDNSTIRDQNIATDYLSTIEIDTLGEIGNISFGSSATTLSTLLNQKVEITTPRVSIIKRSEVPNEFTFDHIRIQVNYIEGFSGKNLLVIKSEDAAVISDIMLGGDGINPEQELKEIHLSAIQEAMNQMMGSAATSMSTVFMKKVDISPPTIHLVDSDEQANTETMHTEEVFVKVSFQLKVGNLVDSNIMQLIPISFAKQLVEQLVNGSNDEKINEQAAATIEIPEKPSKNVAESSRSTQNRQQIDDDFSSPRNPQYLGNKSSPNNVTVQQAEFSNFEQMELNKNEQRNLDMLLDIPLKVTVELGRTKQTIKDILDLSQGSIVELDKLAGEPVDIFVNEKLIAMGEVVVIDENFGVRVTDIISQSARLMNLK